MKPSQHSQLDEIESMVDKRVALAIAAVMADGSAALASRSAAAALALHSELAAFEEEVSKKRQALRENIRVADQLAAADETKRILDSDHYQLLKPN